MLQQNCTPKFNIRHFRRLAGLFLLTAASALVHAGKTPIPDPQTTDTVLLIARPETSVQVPIISGQKRVEPIAKENADFRCRA